MVLSLFPFLLKGRTVFLTKSHLINQNMGCSVVLGGGVRGKGRKTEKGKQSKDAHEVQ